MQARQHAYGPKQSDALGRVAAEVDPGLADGKPVGHGDQHLGLAATRGLPRLPDDLTMGCEHAAPFERAEIALVSPAHASRQPELDTVENVCVDTSR